MWVGGIAALLALWFGGAPGIAAPVFIVGMLTVLVGFLRRRDDRNMARAGTATVVLSSVVLGAALMQRSASGSERRANYGRGCAQPRP